MTREFGEKSYNPAKFYFKTTFAERANPEYVQLFNRKLPGNILLSAYYTPMTIRELSIELGVSTVYLEDEIKLLEKYKLILKVSGDKYQTNIIILTEVYEKELLTQIKPALEFGIKAVFNKLYLSLPDVRKLDFHGNNFDDNRLLWALYIAVIFNGWQKFSDFKKDKIGEYPEIYKGAHGIIFGLDYDENDAETGCCGFAGSSNVGNYPYFTFANFNILSDSKINFNNAIHKAIIGTKFDGNEEQNKLIDEKYATVVNDYLSAEFPVFRREVLEKLKLIIEPAVLEIQTLYLKLAEISTNTLRVHAPKAIGDQVGKTVYYNLVFNMMGYLGVEAVKSGSLIVPDNNQKVAIFGVIE